ncbi:MAG: hydrogenase expression/formation protein HypE [Candidatus Binatia bacterium]
MTRLVEGPQCPVPLGTRQTIVLGHGSGGTMTADLLRQIFLPAFANPALDVLNDQAILETEGIRLAFTTDAFVVSPLFFPGGDIGQLAVHGTINDLAMCGATPLALAAAFILEEGLATETLQQVVTSMARACENSGVSLVTGDTKVVEKGKGDGLFITTSGIGVVTQATTISCDRAQAGDVVIINGPVGDHGIAVLSAREGLEFETTVQSDTAPLHTLVQAMIEATLHVHCLRDPTRGGVATVLNEIATASHVGMVIEETAIPVRPAVQAACDLLGLDPLHCACEGRVVAIVGESEASTVLNRMRTHPLGRDAAIVGRVVPEHPNTVLLRTSLGSTRLLFPLAGAQLPRIC